MSGNLNNPSPAHADLLRRVGRWLHGDGARNGLCLDLGVGDRTMRRWLAGQEHIPGGIWADLATVIEEHQQAINVARWHLHHEMLLATVVDEHPDRTIQF